MTDRNGVTVPKLHLGRMLAGALLVLGVTTAALHVLEADTRNAHVGSDMGRGGAASLPAFVVGESSHRPDVLRTRASAGGEVDALAGIMRKWGLRRIAVCEPADAPGRSTEAQPAHATVRQCAGPNDAIAADARAIAAAHAQAVIYSGTADDAVAFITALRNERSFAMVVLGSSVDRDRVAKALPGAARHWVLAVRRPASDGSDDAQTLTVAMLGSHDRRAR